MGLAAPGRAVDEDLTVGEAHDGAVVVEQMGVGDVLEPEARVGALAGAALAKAHDGGAVADHHRRVYRHGAQRQGSHGEGRPEGKAQGGGIGHGGELHASGHTRVVAQQTAAQELVVVNPVGVGAEAAVDDAVGDVELVQQTALGHVQGLVEGNLDIGFGIRRQELPHAGNEQRLAQRVVSGEAHSQCRYFEPCLLHHSTILFFFMSARIFSTSRRATSSETS